MPVYSLTKEDFPTKEVSVSFVEPTFGDRCKAQKDYPKNEPAFTVEQLLLANSIEDINGVDVTQRLGDPISRLKGFSNPDEQFLMSVFMSVTMPDRDLSESARRISDDMRSQFKSSYTVFKEDMPNGELGFTFSVPTSGDRMFLESKFPGIEECGYSLEALIFASCLTHVNGREVEFPKEPIKRVKDWPNLDFEFALSIFLNVCTISKTQLNQAHDLGKKFRSMRKSGGEKPDSTEETKNDDSKKRVKSNTKPLLQEA